MTTERALVNRETGEIIEVEPEALSVSPAYIQETIKSIALLQEMTESLLVRGRDYGRTPGTPQDGLWDPGASLLIAGFNCYVGPRRILNMVDEENKISIVVEVPIINRHSGREVGSGVGAASTDEVKYKYRWFYPSELEQAGYTKEQIATLRMDKKHPGKHRVDNLERGELLNTLIKQASKRAEVDAAEALPGVASVLREMFDPRRQVEEQEDRSQSDRTKSPPEDAETEDWTPFWGEIRALGLTPQQAHELLKVKSMKEWLTNNPGKGRNDIIKLMSTMVAKTAKAEEPPPESPIDLNWLADSLTQLQRKGLKSWSNASVLTYLKTTFGTEGKKVSEAVLKLNKEQATQWVAEIQAALEMA